MDTHTPYGPPDEPINKLKNLETLIAKLYTNPQNITEQEKAKVLERYQKEVTFLDKQLKKLLDFIWEKLDRKNTLVILISDHGELLGKYYIPDFSETISVGYTKNIERIYFPYNIFIKRGNSFEKVYVLEETPELKIKFLNLLVSRHRRTLLLKLNKINLYKYVTEPGNIIMPEIITSSCSKEI